MKKVMVVIVVFLLSIVSFFSGCEDIPKEITPLSIVTFTIEPNIINHGEYANLTWTVVGASSISIDNGIGNVTLTGNRIIQPTQTTTYILTALNATTTKSVTTTITVKLVQQTQTTIITDGIGDVSSIDYTTSKTSIIYHHPEIDVYNIDIIKATYTQQGTQATVTMQVRGSIEDRGRMIDENSMDFTALNFVEYDFQVTTSEQDYTISYANQTGQVSDGVTPTNLTSSDFTVVGDTLTIIFPLRSATEVYENMSVTSMFVKMNLAGSEPDISSYVYLTDIAPNPALEIMDAYAPNVGVVGSTIQFNGSIIPLTGQPPYQYYWDFGDQGTSTLLNPTHIYTKSGQYTYTFTVTDQAGDTASKTGTITTEE